LIRACCLDHCHWARSGPPARQHEVPRIVSSCFDPPTASNTFETIAQPRGDAHGRSSFNLFGNTRSELCLYAVSLAHTPTFSHAEASNLTKLVIRREENMLEGLDKNSCFPPQTPLAAVTDASSLSYPQIIPAPIYAKLSRVPSPWVIRLLF
jgi:hypothetical protein